MSHRSALRRGLTLAGLALGLAACQPTTPAAPSVTAPNATPTGESGVATVATTPGGTPAAGLPAQIAIASSDLAKGHDRFAFAILDSGGTLVKDASAKVTFFHLEGEQAVSQGTHDAAFYPARLEPAGLYVVYADFDRAGPWGAEIAATLPDGRAAPSQRVRFTVAEQPKSVGVGSAPPKTVNRTLATEPDLAKLTSDPKPDPDLYRLTVEQAVHSGKPTVVVFSTPAYCQSRICGPVLDEVKAVKAIYGDRVNVIHIEVYKQFQPLVLADEMGTWGLETEPWVFVLGTDGRVVERLEGSVTAAELGPIVARVLGGAASGTTTATSGG